MMDIQVFEANGEMVILPRKHYEALVRQRENEDDARAFDEAVAEIEAGEEMFPAGFVERLLETDSPVREWRTYRGLSQEKLAEAAGVRQATISAIEAGSVPKVDTARKIAEALGCDLEDLF